MSESDDEFGKVDVGVQTILHCYEDSQHNIYVSSNRGVQTVISSFPLNDDNEDSIFIGLLGFVPYSEISQEAEKIIVLPRKRKLHWADPFTTELSSTMELSSAEEGSIRSILKQPTLELGKTDQETQTIIAVYPHILNEGDVAHVMQDNLCQTSITALPDESITKLVPILKQQLPHTTADNKLISPTPAQRSGIPPQRSDSAPVDSGHLNSHEDDLSTDSDAAEVFLNENGDNSPEDSSPPEDFDHPENSEQTAETFVLAEEELPAPSTEELERTIPVDVKEIIPEETEPCSKSPCVEKVINRNDCFENKVRKILQMAAEVFFEEHPCERKVELCKQLFNFAGISGSRETTEQYDKALKDLDKIAADGVTEGNIFSFTPNEDIIRPNETSSTNNNSGNCFCQKRHIKDVASPVKRPSKIPRLTQCCGKTAKFCGNQQSSKIPVLTKRRPKVSQQLHPCITSSGPGDCKEVRFTFNLPSSQLFPTIQSKPKFDFNYQLPSTMKRNIQVGVGQCCSTRDGIQIEEVSSPEPMQNFVYECDAGYVESYLQTLGNEIKGSQTEKTELGEGDWDWEEDEEEDPCLCDPWKKIAVPLPGTYVLKKAKKSSVMEEIEQTSTNEIEFVSAESKKLPTLQLVKLPVYDPKYFKMTELYMEPLYDLYPMDTEPEDVCGPETEMPWEDIVLPEKCRIKKANPTICTCPGRKHFNIKDLNETDTQTSSFQPDPYCGTTINISAKAKSKGKSSTIVLHIKSPGDDDDDSSNSNDSESEDSASLRKELPFYGRSKSTGTCGCPKWQPSTDTEGKLPSTSPQSVLEMKSKKKTLDIPSNPPKGMQQIIKNVCFRPPVQDMSCETTDTNKYDQATETTQTDNVKIQCDKPDVTKTCTRTPKQNPKCRCKNTRSNPDFNDGNRCTKESSTCTSKTMVRQRAGANTISKNSVGCGSGIYVSVTAAERDKHGFASTPKTTSLSSSKETNTDRTVPKIKRFGQTNERICNNHKNELFELFSKGQNKGLPGADEGPAKDFCTIESKPENVKDHKTENPIPPTQEDACSNMKPQRKYPVVAALNAFEEEMKPLRAALCQLQKRIYSLDLPEMQSRQSIPRPTVDTAVLAKGPSTVSGLHISTTNVTTSTEPYLCSRNSELDTLMNSSTTSSLSNDSDVTED